MGYGKIRAQVVKMTRPDSKFEVRTSTAVCGVLGTDEWVDGSSPITTIIANFSDPRDRSQIEVHNIDSSIGGKVILNPGEMTHVDKGKPPKPPELISELLKKQAQEEVMLSSEPEAVLALAEPGRRIGPDRYQIEAGDTLSMDARTSSGGSAAIISYLWAIPKRHFISREPILIADTSDWPPGAYPGTLTVTNKAKRNAVSHFTLQVTNPVINQGSPETTIEGLRQAYESLQVTKFMNYISGDYPGWAALESSITTSFANIASNKVYLRRSNGTVKGEEAIYQVDFEIRFLPKASALPYGALATSETAVAPASYRTMANGGTGSVRGSTGAADTFVTLVGLDSGQRLVTNTRTGTGFSFDSLTPGRYEITPARAGFLFRPSVQVVDVRAGAVSTVNFTASGQEQVVRESVTMNLQRPPRGRSVWTVTGLSAPIGSAGLLGIPGAGRPAEGTTVPASGRGLGTVAVTDISLTTSGTVSAVSRGGTSGPVTLTITPINGFTGNVTLNLLMPSGVTAISSGLSGSSFTIPVRTTPVSRTFQFATDSTALPGDVTIGYQATSGIISKQGVLAAFKLYQLTISVPSGALTLYAGGSATLPITVTTAPGVTTPINVSASGPGITVKPATVNGNGTANLAVTVSGNATGLITISLIAAATDGSQTTGQVSANVLAPFTISADPKVTFTAGQAGSISVAVKLDVGFSGQVTVSAPTVAGLTISPPSVMLSQSGTASFSVQAAAAMTTSLSFSAQAGGFSASASTQLVVTAAPPVFTVTGGSLTLTPGSSGQVPVSVTQTAGPAASFVVAASGVDSSLLSVSGGGTLTASGSVQFNVTALAGARPGTTSFTVTATAGAVTQSATITVTINPLPVAFTLTGASVSVAAGGSVDVAIGVTQTAGAPASIAVSAGGVDATRINVSGGATLSGSGTVRFTVSALATAPSGSTSFTVTGVSGSVTQSATVTVTITALGFTISGGSVNVTAGGPAATLDIQVQQATGAPTSFVVSTSGVDATKISVSGGGTVAGTGSVTLTIAALAGAPAGSTAFQVQATGGGVTKTATVTVNITAGLLFSLSGASATVDLGGTILVSVPLQQTSGAPATYSISLAGVDSNTLRATLTSASLVGSGSISVTISALATAPLGTTSFTVTAASGGISHSATVTVTVTGPGVSASANPTSLTLLRGASANVAISVMSGAVAITVTPGSLPNGISAVNLASPSSTVMGSGVVNFTVVAAATSTATSATITFDVSNGYNSTTVTVPVTLQEGFALSAALGVESLATIAAGGSSTTIVLTVTFSPAFAGSVTVSPAVGGALSYILLSGGDVLTGTGTVSYQVSAIPGTTPGSYAAQFTASSGAASVGASYTLSVVAPFTVTSTATSLSMITGTAQLFTAAVTYSQYYWGTVTVTGSSTPTGLLSNLTLYPQTGPPSTTITGTQNLTFSLTAGTSAGTGSVTVQASDAAGNVQSLTVPLTVTPVTGNGVLILGSAPPVSGASGGTASVPVQLLLAGGVSADSLSFGVRVTGASGQVGYTLSFAVDSSISSLFPSVTTDDSTPGRIAAFFPPAAAGALTGTSTLGTIQFAVPPGTAATTYTAQITAVSASYGSTSLSLSAGANSNVSVQSTGSNYQLMSAGKQALSIQPETITYAPSFPRAGDTVRFRMRVRNDGSQDANNAELTLMAGSRVLARQTLSVAANRTATAELEWKAEALRDLKLALNSAATPLAEAGNNNLVPLKGFAVENRGGISSLRRQRQSFEVRNEQCIGLRLNSGMRASCGGSADLEMSPAIIERGRVEVKAAASNGGLVHLGVQPLSTIHTAPDRGYQPQGLLEVGHTYALKTQRGYAVFRIVRVTSSVDPRLASGSTDRPGAGSGHQIGRVPDTDPVSSVRDQRALDSLLTSARISIDIEWLFQEDGSVNFQ